MSVHLSARISPERNPPNSASPRAAFQRLSGAARTSRSSVAASRRATVFALHCLGLSARLRPVVGSDPLLGAHARLLHCGCLFFPTRRERVKVSLVGLALPWATRVYGAWEPALGLAFARCWSPSTSQETFPNAGASNSPNTWAPIPTSPPEVSPGSLHSRQDPRCGYVEHSRHGDT
jgi:hypothetical protein